MIVLRHVRFGVLRLPNGKRKSTLLAEMSANSQNKGNQALARDSYIAACAAAHGFAIATHNPPHCKHLGVRLINPWL